ncbi:cell wall-binding repeat-containing protein [Salirhabdus salicampi]|uniref:cell wall-binding repeat-containing protein n=1 Tax=Salirhabdus salicampi TaxID=476102 RepID=UPI00266D9D38|nr:cell wall-binding repeat-containing protein [Salirhabdus salicampi]
MDLFSDHKLIKRENGYEIILYINPHLTEFSEELLHGQSNANPKQSFDMYVKTYLLNKFPKLKILGAKVLIGSIIVGSFMINEVQPSSASEKATVSQTQTTLYTVKSGDTLFRIAHQFEVSVDDIKAANQLTSDAITTGQTLMIPTVKADVKAVELFGKDRYETSVVISQKGWQNTSDIVVLGRGDLPIDALTSSVLAKKYNSPLLLTKPDHLGDNVVKEINRLQPKTIYLTGGENAISKAIEHNLKQQGYEVKRISGKDRYDTSVQIANEIKHPNELIITTGNERSPDALSVAPYAGKMQIPIVFTGKDKLPDSVKQYIHQHGIKKVTLIGGEGAVSSRIESEIKKIGVSNIERIAGSDRFVTSVKIAERYSNELDRGKVFFASGVSFIDALPASPLAAMNEAPIILTQKDKIPSSLENWVKNQTNTINNVTILGGTGVISPNVRDFLKSNGNIPVQNPSPEGPTVTYTTHTVKSGDNLWNISNHYGIPFNDLLSANNLTQNSSLSIGQQLRIPKVHVPIKPVVSQKHGELLDWWTEARYVFSTGKIATITDFHTGRTFQVKHTMGGNHADSEPLTAQDAQVMKEIWGGDYSWTPRAIIVEVDGRKLAAAMHSYPHGDQLITDNQYNGHFCIHFLNSTRHKDGLVQDSMQQQIETSSGTKQ